MLAEMSTETNQAHNLVEGDANAGILLTSSNSTAHMVSKKTSAKHSPEVVENNQEDVQHPGHQFKLYEDQFMLFCWHSVVQAGCWY